MQEKKRNNDALIVKTIVSRTEAKLIDVLLENLPLSKSKIKDALCKGAVWLSNKPIKKKRVRKANTIIRIGQQVNIFYNPAILRRKVDLPLLFKDYGDYSIWSKPPGILSQGTNFSDHCSILRIVEKHFSGKRNIFPVHRLDREALGLILVAHTKNAAAKLSKLLSNGDIQKKYCIEILGDWKEGRNGSITYPLDDKPSVTNYQVLEANNKKTLLLVHIETGRLHQIRRHFNMLGYPVIGDPRYGTENKNNKGLRLKAVEISFTCPIKNKLIRHALSYDFEKLT